MTLRLVTVYQWVSPISFALAALLVHLGAGSEAAPQDWPGALYWATCGALTATGIIAAILGLVAAQQQLRVLRAELEHARSTTTTPRTPQRGAMHP